jgi:hypothetical protein
MSPEAAKIPYVDTNGKLHMRFQEKWGFIDTTGTVVIEPQFDGVADFSEGLAAVAFDTDRTSYDVLTATQASIGASSTSWAVLLSSPNTVR